MDKGFNAWSTAEKITGSATEKMRRGFGEYINEICLTLCIIFTVAIPLVTVRFVNPLSPDFLANTVYMAISTYTCYLVFIPSGKRDELSAAGTECRKMWEELCDRIRNGKLISKFCLYCEQEAQRERIGAIRRYTEAACIEWDGYCEKYAHMKRGALRREMRCGHITHGQYRHLSRALRVRIRPISPTLILSTAREININDAGRRHMSYEQSAALRKPFTILISSMSLACAVLIPTKTFGVAVVVSIISRIFGLCMASFAGYNVGVRQIRWENARIEGRILFIKKFLEADCDEEISK